MPTNTKDSESLDLVELVLDLVVEMRQLEMFLWQIIQIFSLDSDREQVVLVVVYYLKPLRLDLAHQEQEDNYAWASLP